MLSMPIVTGAATRHRNSLTAVPSMSQLVLRDLPRIGIEHGHLLPARVQFASYECHGIGLLSDSAVAHGEHSHSARPFS